MRSKLLLPLLSIFAIFFDLNNATAENRLAQSARVYGEDNLRISASGDKFFALRSETELRAIKPGLVSLRLPGLGRVRIALSNEWQKSWPSYFTDTHGNRTVDRAQVRLFRGQYQSSRNTEARPVGAAVVPSAQGELLQIDLLATTAKLKRTFSYRLTIEMARDGSGYYPLRVKKALARRVFDDLPEATKSGLKTIALPATVSATDRTVELATEADFEFFQIYGDSSNTTIATMVNSAAAIYSSAFTINFSITFQNTLTSSSQPYTSTDSDTLLDQFADYTNTNAQLGWADIFHLFTGKDIDGSRVGLAFVGVVCKSREQRYAFTQDTGDASDYLTFVHEVGHNFNANHDDVSGLNIMNSSFDPSTPPTSFSATSISEIESHLNKNSKCLGVSGAPKKTVISLKATKNKDAKGFYKLTTSLVSDQGWSDPQKIQLMFRSGTSGAFKTLLKLKSKVTNGTFKVQSKGQYQVKVQGKSSASKIVTIK